MNADQLTRWATAEPWLAALAVGLPLLALAVACYLIVRRAGGNVLLAAIGATVCTAYSADTSWRFARDHLGMTSPRERLFMFAAGEVALFVCGVMARSNKKATATDDSAGTPGVSGVLVWCITSIQLVPAFTESGFWAGIVRGTIGPVMAALLWHLAMGLEIRIGRPEALSTGLPAQIGHELRERLLSYLGLAVRGRTAAQVTRDRATARAVRLASRRWLGPWGRAALKASVARAAVGTSGEQRHQLLQLLAARRSADQLRTLDVTSPWTIDTTPVPHPATPLGVTGAELRRLHPIDAVRTVRDAHPAAGTAELASLCAEYGVPVTEGQVRVALHPKAADAPAQPPLLTVQAPPALAATQPQPGAVDDFDPAVEQAVKVAGPDARTALILDFQPHPRPHPIMCATASAAAQPPSAPAPQPEPAPAAAEPVVRQMPTPDTDAQLLQAAHELNATALAETGQRASLRRLQTELRIGQKRAQRIQAQLPTTLPASDERKAQ